jgi:hypothetical protein
MTFTRERWQEQISAKLRQMAGPMAGAAPPDRFALPGLRRHRRPDPLDAGGSFCAQRPSRLRPPGPLRCGPRRGQQPGGRTTSTLARPCYERSLAIKEKVLGPDHPGTAQSLNNLSMLLKTMGDLAGARPYVERALAIWKKALGPGHPDTAASLNNLGTLLQAMGDLAGARPYYERALAIFTARLGPDHPHTQTVRRNLAALPDG